MSGSSSEATSPAQATPIRRRESITLHFGLNPICLGLITEQLATKRCWIGVEAPILIRQFSGRFFGEGAYNFVPFRLHSANKR